MFGISGGEIFLLLIVILMLFGSKEIPTLARTLGKIIHQVKNASNELKSEISKSGPFNDITNPIKEEIENVKKGFLEQNSTINPQETLDEIEEDIEKIMGPVKRRK